MESRRLVGAAAPPAARVTAIALVLAVVLPALLQASPPHGRDHRHPRDSGEKRQPLDGREKTRTCNGPLNETLAFHVNQGNMENCYIELLTKPYSTYWTPDGERNLMANATFLCRMEFRVLIMVDPGTGVTLYHTERRCSRRGAPVHTDPATGFTFRCVDLVRTQIIMDRLEVCGPVGCVGEPVA